MGSSLRFLLGPVLFMTTLVLFGGCTTETTNERVYGPRWTDYRAWGQLTLGMSREATIGLLGEPYLPEGAASQSVSNTETLVFKIRPKFYTVKRLQTTTVRSATSSDVEKTTTAREIYPEKSGDTELWGDLTDLYCSFQNGKLMRWDCPAMHLNIEYSLRPSGATEQQQKK
jgi:hypothetical protein